MRAVLFDAGATLVHPSPPVEEIYARELAADGARFSPDALDRALTRAWEEVHAAANSDRYGGVRGEAAFWRGFLNGVRSRLDGGAVSPACFDRLAKHFRNPDSWSIYDDVSETLDALAAQGRRVGIVSNWDSHLPALLDGLGLTHRFEVVAVSAIEQVGKPHPEIFRRACARLDLAASDCLHVGDSMKEDYEGAKGAGLRALLLDRENKHAEMTERIRSLAEIPGRIESEDRKGAGTNTSR